MIKHIVENPDCYAYADVMFDTINAGFILCEVIYDYEGKASDLLVLKINNTAENMLNIDREWSIGRKINQIIPDSRYDWVEIYGDLSGNGNNIRIPFKDMRSNRRFKADLISLQEGRLAILITDITPVLKAEEALKKHSLIFENAHDIILYLDSEGAIIDANKTAAAKYGYTRQELLAMNIRQLRHPSTMKDFNEQMNVSMETGIVFECTHVKKDGTSFPVEVSSRTVLINDEWHRIHIVRDITKRRLAEEKINFLVNYDALTGIYNRRYLTEQLGKEIRQAQRNRSKFALMVMDVDSFKSINDMYGHNAGDEVLRRVSERLTDTVRQSDYAGRWGGDEFLVLQPDIHHKEDADRLAQRIIDAVGMSVNWDGEDIPVHLSIGISVFPDDSTDSQGLVRCADEAMYKVKQRGGNSFAFY